jgi:alkanesulfonate monooxygenase SsuD/methylene tetrahydromethanopterin reductase-like flavin-dependent oxidoreductase (luciferase family)
VKLGLNFFPVLEASQKSASEWFMECISLAQLAEGGGFEFARTVEHHGGSYGGYSPSPIPFLAAIAQKTSRLRLQTGCVVPAFHHPLRLAEELAMLDHLSNGRLDVGFARGFLPQEFELFGASIEDSREVFVSGIEKIRNFWRSSSKLGILPLQEPHPPLWIAATSSMESYVYAGENGFNLMTVAHLSPLPDLREKIQAYRTSWAGSGREAGRERVQLGIQATIAETTASAQAIARVQFELYNSQMLKAVKSWADRPSKSYPMNLQMPQTVESLEFDLALSDYRLLAGDVQDVVHQMDQITNCLGDVEFSIQVNTGLTEYFDAYRTVNYFSDILETAK